MLLVPLIGVTYVLLDTDAPSSNAADRKITYHRGHSDSDLETYDVYYDGIASAEYNPQYWGSDNGGPTWVGPKSDETAILVVDYEFRQWNGPSVVESSFSIGDGEGKVI